MKTHVGTPAEIGRVSEPAPERPEGAVVVNDIHSGLNATRPHQMVRPDSVAAVRAAVRRAAAEGRAVSVAGGRHAMGGQQFGEGTVLLDMGGLDRVLGLDAERGIVEVEAGIQWPALVERLLAAQAGQTETWGIRQKQTGADRFSIGGALAANVHGRGLAMAPIVVDVESFVLVDAAGEVRRCDRQRNADLFRLAIGGYGLFGVVTSVRLRLARRRKLRRVVRVVDLPDLPAAFETRIADGFLYGDFQFSVDERGDDFLRRGVFSCYLPVADDTPIPAGQRVLSTADWLNLLRLGHTDRRRAVDAYTAHYLATDGQVYWSDLHQMGEYLDGYHAALDVQLGAAHPGSEVISELYVPREALPAFMEDARDDFRTHGVEAIYGTVRLIERDDESFLPWARDRYACVIFNLHVEHTPDGQARAAEAVRRLIDRAARRGGSYYLTYHRHATRQQVETCHPRFVDFLRLKRLYDPAERFQSEWYRHYRAMFADVLPPSVAAGAAG